MYLSRKKVGNYAIFHKCLLNQKQEGGSSYDRLPFSN